MNTQILIAYHSLNSTANMISSDVLRPILLGATNASKATLEAFYTKANARSAKILRDDMVDLESLDSAVGGGRYRIVSMLMTYLCKLCAIAPIHTNPKNSRLTFQP